MERREQGRKLGRQQGGERQEVCRRKKDKIGKEPKDNQKTKQEKKIG